MKRALLSAALFGLIAAQGHAATVGELCRRVDRPKEGDTLWLAFSSKAAVTVCAEMHDGFRRTKWYVYIGSTGGNNQAVFSTEQAAVAFIRNQPAPADAVAGEK